jgi:hypothetical protein
VVNGLGGHWFLTIKLVIMALPIAKSKNAISSQIKPELILIYQ